ncbi:MAG TPA: AmmeMemoRadiSam system protein B [Thermodesulfobacteriota bacterium]|nr:AmmeMemoRadiSam system protein B [Thermodesulfobacteriota bacterium]
MDYPKLRYIEAFPIETKGERLICLRDPQNLSGKVLFVSSEALFIISLFDGRHSILDIQEAFMRRFGTLVFRDEIQRLINQLDEALMLDSENYRDFKKRFEEEFKNSTVRESSHAGLSYPSDPNELKGWIDGFFKRAEETNPSNIDKGRITGIISPHIDFRRGGRSYAIAYRELVGSCDSDLFIIFGTSHYADVENPFILTRKSFITPFGEAETDTGIVEELVRSCNWDPFEGEIFHRQEHSIEFQVVFLQYLFGGRKGFRIVPILCNSFFRMIQNGDSPKEYDGVSTFLGKVREIVSGLGGRVFIVAGADLAHVGLKFGDPEPVKESTLRWIRERDLVSLSFTEQVNAEGFFRSIAEERDKRKVCGLSPIYALLDTVRAERGSVLDYDQALEPDTGSVVSFASVGFYT